MKRIISPYLIGLFRENNFYIALNVIMFILILFFLFSNSQKIMEDNDKVSALTKETANLQQRVTVFNKAFLDSKDVDQDIKILNALLPNTEDYFSVIYTLDKLSRQTNFIINSYTINLKSSTSGKLKLSIVGTGDRNSFLKFLNEYNFGGGRLITSDKMELTPQISGQIKLDIAFYSKETSLTKVQMTKPLSETLLQELTSLNNKVGFDLKESTNEGQFDLNYPRKSNPF